MFIPTTASLPFAKPPKTAFVLAHHLHILPNSQARLRGRSVLEPAVELDSYRFEALIDWIELQVSFDRMTQIQHVHHALEPIVVDRKCHITRLNTGDGGTFSECRIRIQEPKSLAQVITVASTLSTTFGARVEPSVSALEVSLDIYARNNEQEDRRALLGALQRTIWTGRDIWSNPNSRPRMAYAKGAEGTKRLIPPPDSTKDMACALVPEHHMPPALDSTVYLGAQDDDVMIRLMEKIIDTQRQDGTCVELENEECRVRVEVTLRGAELDLLKISKVSQLKTFKFAQLKKRYFHFKLPTFRSTSNAALVQKLQDKWHADTYLRTGVLGVTAREAESRRLRKRHHAGLLKHLADRKMKARRKNNCQSTFVTWSNLHVKLDAAFRQLDKRQATALRRQMFS